MTAASQPAPALLTLDALLARIEPRLALLRGWLAHDHADTVYWWARRITASEAQCERAILRRLADLLYLERATLRGRVHARFADADAQRAFVAKWEHHRCATAARFAGVAADATIARLRAGELVV